MKQIIKAGTTSKRVVVFVQSTSSGTGVTGLTHASSGLEAYYYREDSGTSTTITLAAETLGTWTSGGFAEIDSTNMPGFYEVGLPNAVVANTNGATWATMMLQGYTGMLPVNVEIQLVQYDPTNGTSLGLTLMPSNVTEWLGTAVTSNAGVPIVSATGTVTATVPTTVSANVVQWLGTNASGTAGIPDINVKNWNHHTAQSDVNNLPEVDIEDINGTAVTMSTGNLVTTPTITFPTNFAALAITSGGAITLGTGQIFIRKDTSLPTFTFPMFSSTTGALLAGLSVSTFVSIDGGSPTGTTHAASSIGSGLYALSLAAADLDGVVITLIMTATGATDQAITFVTQP